MFQIIAMFPGTCKCGRAWKAGYRIERDPVSQKISCIRCSYRRQELARNNIAEVVSDSDPFTDIVERMKRIGGLPSRSPQVLDEYWQLFDKLQYAPPRHSSVKPFLESRAICKTKEVVPYVVMLSREQRCVHCNRLQNDADDSKHLKSNPKEAWISIRFG